jgi:hypothetical protein
MTNDFNPDAPSQGFGDTIAKITHAVGLDKVAENVAKALGQEDCGCNKRREALNRMMPYTTTVKVPTVETEYQFNGSKTYEILINLTINKDGVSTRYKAGEVIVVNSATPIYPFLQMLLAEGKIKLN